MTAVSFQFSTVRAAITDIADTLRVKLASRRIMFGPGFSDRAAAAAADKLTHAVPETHTNAAD